jgi:hypothetical protein
MQTFDSRTREYALCVVEALERFERAKVAATVPECVLCVLALESEPVEPLVKASRE